MNRSLLHSYQKLPPPRLFSSFVVLDLANDIKVRSSQNKLGPVSYTHLTLPTSVYV